MNVVVFFHSCNTDAVIHETYAGTYAAINVRANHRQQRSVLHSLIQLVGGGGGLVASCQSPEFEPRHEVTTNSESRVRASARDGYFSLVLPPSDLRSPTCCHNTILDGTAKLYARGASAGSISFSIRNEASLKKSNPRY